MSLNAAKESAYMEHVARTFTDAMKKIASMEANFQPSMVKEYESVRHQAASRAVDLVKMGVDYITDGQMVGIQVGEDIYDVACEDIKDVVDGEEEFKALFPEAEQESSEKTEQEPDNETDFSESDPSMQEYPYSYGSSPMPNMNGVANQMNPLVGLVNYFLAPFMQQGVPGQMMYQQPMAQPQSRFKKSDSSGLLDDVNSFQQKIVALERERNEAKSKVVQMKDTCDKLQKQIADTEERLAAERAEADGQVEALLSEREELNGLLSQAMSNVSTVAADRDALEKQIKDLTDRISVKEKELADKTSHYESLMDLKKKMENDLTDLRRVKEEEKSVLEKRIAELERSLADARNQLNQAKEKLAKADAEAKAKETGVQIVAKDNEKKISDLEKQLATQRERADKSTKRADESDKYINKLKEEKKSVESDLDDAKKESEKFKNEVKKLRENEKEKADFYKKLEEKNSELTILAYEDQKIGTMNLNAFNRDFIEISKNDTILAIVSICDVKKINIEYGKSAGDNLIKAVASHLVELYGKENVYRILGDQFAIIITNENNDQVQGRLTNAQSVLMQDSIKIVFGTAIGSNCEDAVQMVGIADNMMAQMKGAMLSGTYMPQAVPVMEPAPQPAPQPVPQPMSQPVVTSSVSEDSGNTDDEGSSGLEEVSIDQMLMSYMS